MSLQNRVTPQGEIIADPSRGLFMGNRGGRIHTPATRTLTARRWASRRWICCVTAFKARRRKVMGESYTELFFLDEVTALAAGHRPCYECRRNDARAFARYWSQAHNLGAVPRADAMDIALHGERLDGRSKRLHAADIQTLPDGVAVLTSLPETPAIAYHVRGDRLLAWSASGYCHSIARPKAGRVHVLTPPSICAVLAAGYQPTWHPSAETVK